MTASSHFSLETIDIMELLHGIPHPVAILDNNLQVIAMNYFLEAMTGFLATDVKGIQYDFILRPNFSKRNSPFARVLATGDSITVNGNILTLHHRKVPIRFTISPLGIPEKRGILAVLEDITLEQDNTREHLPYVGAHEILGHSPQMQEIFELIPILAQTGASVLITGETGTGKDMVAETIHKTSTRAHHPFIKINCGALPESLLESELFGHVKGAFTGATQDKPGMFRLAHGGTVFLTEIGDLPLQLQIKLLSVLDDHEFFPVGGSKKVKVDVRIMAATHRSLQSKVREETFREDLFFRLNVLRLHLPALRDRDGDVRLLLDHFLRKFDKRLGKGNRHFTRDALDVLCKYHYPGNVRELRNVVEYAANICHDSQITVESLPKYIFKPFIMRSPETMEKAPTKIYQDSVSTVKGRKWQEVEKEMIIEALRKSSGNRSQASKLLGWGRTTLWRKLKTHNLQ